jgi:hypothetical protein
MNLLGMEIDTALGDHISIVGFGEIPKGHESTESL